MKKSQKILLLNVIVVLCIIGIIGGLYGYHYYAEQKKAREAAAEIKRREGIVESYKDIAYGNKMLGNVDLSGMTIEEIIEQLKTESKIYKERRATISVDGDTYSYSMKNFGEDIFYKTSDSLKFKLGEEEKLASIFVNMDKDKEMQEQYSIISGSSDASKYSVVVKCKYNKKKLNKFIKKLEKNHVKVVVNSHIDKNGNITDSKKGKSLELKKIRKKLKKYLNSDNRKDYKAEYTTSEVKPEWKKDDLKKVDTVISEFSTTFVSYSDRGHNIQVGASRINNTCLLPGERVSFDKVIHDSSDGQGFQAAGSYLNGQVIQTEGGGICQVSTTAYNAILRAGILPVKRLPHSMPVHYVPLGLDAAISAGSKDLVIENTLSVPILIKAFTYGNNITFQIVSYAGALKGYSYVPRAVQLSSLKAEAYLDIYKDGVLKESKLLHTDTYREES